MRVTPNARPLLAGAGLLAITALLGAGCDSPGDGSATPGAQSSPPIRPMAGTSSAVAPAATGEVRGVFLPYEAGATAVTYNPKVVPAGATAELTMTPAGDGVTVRLSVTGMVPHRVYGAHLHTDPCTGKPAEAGPHYQHLPDPKAVASPPSVDPSFANPRNEVWLDFVADALGAATVDSTKTWPFDEINPPRSLVVHAEQTKIDPDVAGTAGPRVACLTLPA